MNYKFNLFQISILSFNFFYITVDLNCQPCFISLYEHIVSWETEKVVSAVQWCSVENQKGTIAVQILWQQCPSGSKRKIIEQC